MKDILRNWDALIAAHTAAFGRIKQQMGKHACYVRRNLVQFIWRYTVVGHAQLPDWCHEVRKKATTGRGNPPGVVYGRGVTRDSLFVASGLERGWQRTVPEATTLAARDAAEARLLAYHEPVAPDVLSRLDAFVQATVNKADRSYRKGTTGITLPTPSVTATFEAGRRLGGQAAAFDRAGSLHHEVRAHRVRAYSSIVRTYRTGLLARYLLARLRRRQHNAREASAMRRSLGFAFPRFGAHNAPGGTPTVPTRRGRKAGPASAAQAAQPLEERLAALRRAGGVQPGHRPASAITLLADGSSAAAVPTAALDLAAGTDMPMAPSDDEVLDLRRENRLTGWTLRGARDALSLGFTDTEQALARLHERVPVPAHLFGPVGPVEAAQVACECAAARTAAGRTSSARLEHFVEKGGKLRLATIHEADIVMASRATTAWLLGRLRNIPTNARMLRNESVRLRPNGKKGCKAYSADLSKATDRISSALAYHVLNSALRATDAPSWMRAALPAITSNIVLENLRTHPGGAITTCGALMGLGPSWTVLSLLNDFAAIEAGADHRTFAVNGDDLLGHWPATTCRRYEASLRSLRLVPNHDKSYFGTHGVFCEMFASLGAKGDLVARPCHRIGAASGVKAIDGQRGDLVADDLRAIAAGTRPPGWTRTHSVVRRLAAQTLRRTTYRLPDGPRALGGGGGRGRLTATGLADFILHGPAPSRTKGRTHCETQAGRLRHAWAEDLCLRAIVTNGPSTADEGRVRLADAIAKRASADMALIRAKGDWLSQARASTVSARDRTKRVLCRHKRASEFGPFRALDSPAARLRWTAADRARAYKQAQKGRYESAARYLRTHTRFVADEEISSLFSREQRMLFVSKPNPGAEPPVPL